MSKIIRKAYLDEKDTFKLSVSNHKIKGNRDSLARVVSMEENYIDTQGNAQKLIREAYQKAENIIKEAETEAQTQLEKTQKQVEAIKAKAYDEGFKSGFEDGVKQGLKEYKKAVQSLIEEKKRFYAQRESMVQETEKDLVELALTIAEKVIQKELTKDDEFILRLVRENLQQHFFNTHVIIRVSKDDHQHLASKIKDIKKEIGYINQIDLIGDVTLEKGSCIIEAPSGSVDASVKQQLDILKAKLLEDYR